MRCPFLDVDLASFCISLPSRLKINGTSDKLLLREAFADAWSPRIRTRSKQGFGAPVTAWFNQSGLKELSHAIFDKTDHPLFQLLDRKSASAYFQSGNYQTWFLLNLGLWLESNASFL